MGSWGDSADKSAAAGGEAALALRVSRRTATLCDSARRAEWTRRVGKQRAGAARGGGVA